MNTNIEQQLQLGKKATLTLQEKESIRHEIVRAMQVPSPIAILSPFMKHFNWMFFTKATAIAVIVLLVGGSSLTYASENALPGDLLYPVKIHVKEEIEVSFANTPMQKVTIQKERIERRISEVKTLKATGALTPKKVESVTIAFVDHAKELNQNIDELQSEGNNEAVLNVTSSLLPALVEFQKDSASNPVIADATATLPPVVPEPTTIGFTEEGIKITTTQDEPTNASTTEALPADTIANLVVDTTTTSIPTIDLSAAITAEVVKMQAQQTETLSAPSAIGNPEIPEIQGTSDGTVPPLHGIPVPQVIHTTTEVTNTLPVSIKTKIDAKIALTPTKTGTLSGKITSSKDCNPTGTTCAIIQDYSLFNIVIYSADGKKFIAGTSPDTYGNFQIDLAPATYAISMEPIIGTTIPPLPVIVPITNSLTTFVTIENILSTPTLIGQ
ncbi:hypothetical protein IPF86_04340 [Candidatus Nomurabacteria bacterium]|nr:MAG: hypothetical protein IPF86_04340 [Candidatus Nomurabacteria bacterium]